MNRLTKRYSNGVVTLDADAFMETQETIDREIQNCYPAKKAIERLVEYEDAEENGLLVRLPCKVGDTVYVNDDFGNLCVGMVFDIRFIGDRVRLQIALNSSIGYRFYCAGLEDFGKTVFLTREEAEQALEGEGQ